MTLRGLALVIAAASLSGCLIVDSGPGPDPGPGPGPGPGPFVCVPNGILTSRILPGAAAPDPGYDGVIITANVGGSYRITWDNTWMFNKIEGTVTTSSCQQPVFTPGCRDGSCALMARDRVILGTGPGQIFFEGYPGGFGRSGFDIVIGDAHRLMVDVLVNGVRDPARVVFVSTDTGALASAPVLPFALTTQ